MVKLPEPESQRNWHFYKKDFIMTWYTKNRDYEYRIEDKGTHLPVVGDFNIWQL